MDYTAQDLINGDKILLYIVSGSASTPVAFATSVNLEVNGDTIDASNKFSPRWNAAIAGKNNYTISCDSLYTNVSGYTSYDTLFAQMTAGNFVDWKIGTYTATTGTSAYEMDTEIAHGNALITSLSLNAGNNEIASCSITLTGNGAVTKTA